MLPVILMLGAITFSTRAAPFLLSKYLRTSKTLKILETALPGALLLLLTIHSAGLDASYPEVIAIAITAAVHYWKRITLLSIATGTATCILLHTLL